MNIEIGVRVWLILQGEVPPLSVYWLETVTQHSLTQYHAVMKLLRGDGAASRRIGANEGIGIRIATEIRMTLRTEEVECATHIQFLLRIHIEEGEVNRRAASVTALLGYVALHEEHRLVQLGVEVSLHKGIGNVSSPPHEVVHRLLWSVGIIYLQSVAHLFHLVANGAQTVSSCLGQQCRRALITVYALTHEVVGGVIANLQYGPAADGPAAGTMRCRR